MKKNIIVNLADALNPHKSYADSTLKNMSKEKLIEYIRVLEYNYNVAIVTLDQQAKNFEILSKASLEESDKH